MNKDITVDLGQAGGFTVTGTDDVVGDLILTELTVRAVTRAFLDKFYDGRVAARLHKEAA